MQGSNYRSLLDKNKKWLQNLAFLAIAILLLGNTGGCGDGRDRRLLVSGIVTIDGAPMTYGFVRMVPEGGGRAASGTIDSDGRFTMTTYKINDGVVPGTHYIEIVANEPLSETKTKWHAPKKYGSRKTSSLTATIEEATDNLLIELTWDGGKPFVETL